MANHYTGYGYLDWGPGKDKYSPSSVAAAGNSRWNNNDPNYPTLNRVYGTPPSTESPYATRQQNLQPLSQGYLNSLPFGQRQQQQQQQQPQQSQQPQQQFGQQQQQSGYSPFSGNAQVTSGVQPQSIYSPQDTSRAVNLIQAQRDQASNVPYLMKQFDRPGVSRSAASLSLVAPLQAQNSVAADEAAAQIPLDDEVANQSMLLAGQGLRERDILAKGELSARLNEMNRAYGDSRSQEDISLYGRLFGGQ